MDQTFLLQLNRWNEEEEYQKIIEAVEALPEEEKTPVLISEMACAYNNLAEADDSRLFEKAAELLESPELPAEQLSEMMRSAAEAGLCPDSTLLTVVRSLESLGSTAALGRVEAGEAGGVQTSGAVLLRPVGTAELTPEQWRGVSYFSGDSRQLEYTLDYKGGKLYTNIAPVQSRLTAAVQTAHLLDRRIRSRSRASGILP